MRTVSPPQPKELLPARQRRMDALLDKNRNGTITAAERTLLEELVDEAQQIMAENARRLAKFSRSRGNGPSADAVPVTVWVEPEAAGR